MFSKSFFQLLRRYSLKAGDSVSVRRRITPEDVKAFADLTRDHNPIHSDGEKSVVHGALLNGIVSAVLGTSLPGFGTVVVHQDLRFPKPCYAGEEVTVEVRVKSARKIVEVEFRVLNGESENERQIVLEGSAKLLVAFNQNSMKYRKEVNSYGHDYAEESIGPNGLDGNRKQ